MGVERVLVCMYMYILHVSFFSSCCTTMPIPFYSSSYIFNRPFYHRATLISTGKKESATVTPRYLILSAPTSSFLNPYLLLFVQNKTTPHVPLHDNSG